MRVGHGFMSATLRYWSQILGKVDKFLVILVWHYAEETTLLSAVSISFSPEGIFFPLKIFFNLLHVHVFLFFFHLFLLVGG